MSQEKIIRAWKDEDFRNNLSEKERTLLPEHPAGFVELSDEELGIVAGARFDLSYNTLPCCTIVK